MPKQLSAQIKKLLEDYPQLRNDDRQLMLSVWRANHPQYFKTTNERHYMDIKGFLYVDSPETIRRTRQKIQRENLHLRPTDEKVAKARRFKQDNIWTSINTSNWDKHL